MLIVCATALDTPATSLRMRMDTLVRDYGHVLRQARAVAIGPAEAGPHDNRIQTPRRK
jgi:hypothetical protein